MGVGVWQLVSVSMTQLGIFFIQTTFTFYYVRVFVKRYGLAQEWLDVAESSLILMNLFLAPALGILQEFAFGGKLRNRRRMILFGGPFLVGAYLLPWFPWHGAGQDANWITGLQLVTVLFFYNFFFVLTFSAYCGLYAEVSNDPHDRVTLFSMSMICALIARSLIFPVEKASNSLEDFALFQKLVMGFGVGAAVCFAITGFTASDIVAHAQSSIHKTHPYHEEEVKEKSGKEDKVGLIPSTPAISVGQAPGIIWQVFHSTNFWSAVFSNLAGGWMRTIGYSNFLAIYTMLLVPEDILPPGSYALSTFFTLCQLFPQGAVAVVSYFIARRFGAKLTLQAGYLLAITNSALCLLLKPWLGFVVLIPFLFVEGVLVGFVSMYVILMGEIVDEDVARNERSHPVSTLIFTLNQGFVRGSIGLAPILVTAMLNSGGFAEFLVCQRRQPNVAIPSAQLQETAFLVCTLYPAILSAVALAFLAPYSLPLPKNKQQPLPDPDLSHPSNEEI